MYKQTIQFAVETKNKTVQKIGRSFLLQPKGNPNCKGVKWYEDKLKESK